MMYALGLLVLAGVYCFWKYPDLRKTWYWLPRRGWVVFMYHHIGTCPIQDEQFPFTIHPAMFEKQLLFLKQNHYTPVHEEEVVRALQTGHTHITKPVLLTFDDGHADNYTNLLPLLKKYQVPVLIFLITQRIGTPGYLTWQHVQEMQQSGLVAFGSHTCTHRRLRDLSDEEINREIVQSKKILEEKLNTTIVSFCYPFGAGSTDPRVRPEVLKAGYLLDFSTKKGINPWPWKGKKSILRAVPLAEETLWDYHLQLTRGRSKL